MDDGSGFGGVQAFCWSTDAQPETIEAKMNVRNYQ